ncbi:PTS sugar transporter subunit IIA [Proteiniborus sp. MB09-C3]|uniref:PTS sugar transporter subunit IIA n=1 Tax=Proteiniborus sp. MB09-C3 TaxID=3050072 RepID=UPI002554B48E|nr:PTS sugar transporter subunit IIA [Proteiniborus sp. MB09-C3]WIV11601.1 PTS sugar transporter subunit IIA [Proteiniborus sp. MB09-C3]
MLIDLITESSIELAVNAEDWEEAVRKGGELLERSGAVENRYIDAMINMVKEIGPYVVISKGMAFPHARPEDGVLRTGMSLITLKEAVKFGDEEYDPIKLIISFCSTDSEGHLNALSELVDFLRDEEAIKNVINAKCKSEVIKIMKKVV